MPSIITHVAVPLALRLGLGGKVVPTRLAACGAIGSMLPDLDVLGLRLGVPYASDFGHRGFTHSLVFAAALALAGAGLRRWLGTTFLAAFLFLFPAIASHGRLDTLTDGGFFSARGAEVLQSELIWVWAPALVAGLALLAARRR